MNLDTATEIERRLYDVCLRVERELPAGELSTAIVTALSEAGEQLQRVRLLHEAHAGQPVEGEWP